MGVCRPKALITGIAGQDGSYLAEFLLERDYDVWGVVRSAAPHSLWRIQHIVNRLTILEAGTDTDTVPAAIERIRPTEVYNLAAVSSIGQAGVDPAFTLQLNGQSVAGALEAILAIDPSIRFCQASSAEIFGAASEVPQRETTPLNPRNTYGEAKAAAHRAVIRYREENGLFAVSAILFNHESPRRGLEFVTRRVTDQVARIKLGLADALELGNLDARRDWGFAGDFVRAMWLMLQCDKAEDYVISTGISHSVRDLVEVAFGHVGLDWNRFVRLTPALARAPETHVSLGDSSRARERLGWVPTTSFQDLVKMMVDADLARLEASVGPR